tara:strand:+ start:278 stop:430 length:153 start_codon:yes stop_codon:yes gene_type:complete
MPVLKRGCVGTQARNYTISHASQNAWKKEIYILSAILWNVNKKTKKVLDF